MESRPTPYDELNELLDELVRRARDILGEDFVGAYLQGSFAVGDADLHSDCDFLVPVHRPPDADQEAGLRALHRELPARDGHWTHHLEGSYPVASELRTLGALGREWLYVDHGWREMQWSTHCNTEVARWSLRERGVVLAGPPPTDLVDPVPPEALRRRMLESVQTLWEDISGWAPWDVAWTQRYTVSTCARTLYTLRHVEVASKRAALEWAAAELDPCWRPLLRQVLADRARGWDPDDPPRPGSVEAARAFAEHARALAPMLLPVEEDRTNRSSGTA